MLFDQTLNEIRQELTQVEGSGVSDEEYIAMLTRHTSHLVELVNNISRTEETKIIKSFQPDSGNFHEEILNLIDGFYFVMDDKFSFHFVSASVQEHLGVKASELTNKKITSILSPDSVNAFRKAMEETTVEKANPRNRIKLELDLKDVEGKQIFCELSLGKDLAKGLWLGLFTSLNNYKIREEQLINERNNAELNDKLKSVFLSNMSHEIRTPLNGIIGFSTMLGHEEISPEKRSKYLRIIRSSTNHLLTLVNDIIDHSKIEAGELKIMYHKVNVHQVLDDLLATFISEAKRLEKNNLRIVKQVPRARVDLIIKSDEVRLKQVLNNLLGNALKFTEKGAIYFGYTLDVPGSIRFFVRDSGIGLSASAQKTIFNRFKQTREGKKDKYEGTGLGLAISKGILSLMDGEIGVNSEPNKGAEFYFTFPLEEDE